MPSINGAEQAKASKRRHPGLDPGPIPNRRRLCLSVLPTHRLLLQRKSNSTPRNGSRVKPGMTRPRLSRASWRAEAASHETADEAGQMCACWSGPTDAPPISWAERLSAERHTENGKGPGSVSVSTSRDDGSSTNHTKPPSHGSRPVQNDYHRHEACTVMSLTGQQWDNPEDDAISKASANFRLPAGAERLCHSSPHAGCATLAGPRSAGAEAPALRPLPHWLFFAASQLPFSIDWKAWSPGIVRMIL